MQENLPYEGETPYLIEDYAFYFWWIFSKLEFLPKEKSFIFGSVLPLRNLEDRFFTYLGEHIAIEEQFFTGFSDHSDIETRIPSTKNDINQYPEEAQEIFSYALEALKDDNCIPAFDLLYLHDICEIKVGKDIYFMQRGTNKEGCIILKEKLDDYITAFIQGELLADDKNFFNFEKQKQILISEIQKMKIFENFGKNFIISNQYQLRSPAEEGEKILFLHTLYALEKLGFIEVLKLWFDREKDNTIFYANILPKESFKELVYNDYRKNNAKAIIQGFDESTDTLLFGNKKIQFSKGQKATDAVLLMRAIINAEDWMFEDEILEEWGYRNGEEQKKLPKNKVYSACLKVQNTMKIELNIDDFLDFKTSKVRINPKYHKIDE